MNHMQSIDINESTKEEMLFGFTPDFPHTMIYAEPDKYIELQAPWHWHRTVELFYVQSGTLEYTTPKGKWLFHAGSGGFINFNVLHTSRVVPSADSTVQLLHLFSPALLSGEHGSRIEKKYVLPLSTASNVEVIPLYPDNPVQSEILKEIKRSFELSEQDWGFEFKIREALSEIWLKLFALARPAIEQGNAGNGSDDKIKMLMIYVHEHYGESISVEQLAQEAHISKRVCFRLFQETLRMTPVEYIRSYRLQKACQMLAKTKESVTQIAYSCGLGSSSYFGKTFREKFGCSPLEFRKYWHDRDKNLH